MPPASILTALIGLTIAVAIVAGGYAARLLVHAATERTLTRDARNMDGHDPKPR
jgi:hypothetical protein